MAKSKSGGIKIKSTPGEFIFDVFNHILLFLIAFITLYPFWYVTILSLNNGRDAMMGGIWFFPRKFTLDNYIFVLSNPRIHSAYLVTIARTLVGTALTLIVCILTAYSLSKRNLRGRNIFLTIYLVPMFIGGTMASTYLTYGWLGLNDTFWVYVIPGCFSFFYMVIIRTFIYGLPPSLDESAKIDGAGPFRILVSIVLPLCTPVIATVGLYAGVGHWLDFGTNLYYVRFNQNLMVLQYLLYQVIRNERMEAMGDAALIASGGKSAGGMSHTTTSESIRMATLMVTTLPILLVYPFVQKYFVKGMMLGALKE